MLKMAPFNVTCHDEARSVLLMRDNMPIDNDRFHPAIGVLTAFSFPQGKANENSNSLLEALRQVSPFSGNKALQHEGNIVKHCLYLIWAESCIQTKDKRLLVAKLAPLIRQIDRYSSKELASILFFLARMQEVCRVVRKETIASLFQTLDAHDDCSARDKANGLWALGKFIGYGYRLDENLWGTFDGLMARLADDDTINAQDIGNSLWALGKCIDCEEHSSYLSTAVLEKLMLKLTESSSVRAQNIANALWAAGKCLEHGYLLNPELSAVCNQLLVSLSSYEEADYQNVSNSLWALGKAIECGHRLDEKTQGAFKRLLVKLGTLDPSPQAIANSLWALGKRIEYDPVPPNTVHGVLDMVTGYDDETAMNRLLIKLASKDAGAQAIANSLWAVGKSIENGYRLNPRSSVAFNNLIIRLTGRQGAIAQHISSVLWAMGKCLKHGYRLNEESQGAFSNLLMQLNQYKSVSTQSIANALWAVGMCVESAVFSDNSAVVFNALFIKLANRDEASAQHFANSLWALGKFVSQYNLTQGTSDACNSMLMRLANNKGASAQHIGNSLWAVGNCVAHGHRMHPHSSQAFNRLLTHLTKKEDTNPQNIANSLGALGKCIEHGVSRISLNALNALLLMLVKRQGINNAQNIAAALLTSGRAMMRQHQFSQESLTAINRLSSKLICEEHPCSQAIANSLWGISMLVAFSSEDTACLKSAYEALLAKVGCLEKLNEIELNQVIQSMYLTGVQDKSRVTEQLLSKIRPVTALSSADITRFLGARFPEESALQHETEAFVEGFFVDIYIPAKKLIVEIDGRCHSNSSQVLLDKLRDRWLTEKGYAIMRVAANKFYSNQRQGRGNPWPSASNRGQKTVQSQSMWARFSSKTNPETPNALSPAVGPRQLMERFGEVVEEKSSAAWERLKQNQAKQALSDSEGETVELRATFFISDRKTRTERPEQAEKLSIKSRNLWGRFTAS